MTFFHRAYKYMYMQIKFDLVISGFIICKSEVIK